MPWRILRGELWWYSLSLTFKRNSQKKKFFCFNISPLTLGISQRFFLVWDSSKMKQNHWNALKLLGFLSKSIWFLLKGSSVQIGGLYGEGCGLWEFRCLSSDFKPSVILTSDQNLYFSDIVFEKDQWFSKRQIKKKFFQSLVKPKILWVFTQIKRSFHNFSGPSKVSLIKDGNRTAKLVFKKKLLCARRDSFCLFRASRSPVWLEFHKIYPRS